MPSPPNCSHKEETGCTIYTIFQPAIQVISLEEFIIHKSNSFPETLHELAISTRFDLVVKSFDNMLDVLDSIPNSIVNIKKLHTKQKNKEIFFLKKK
jgi:hypothetical protein